MRRAMLRKPEFVPELGETAAGYKSQRETSRGCCRRTIFVVAAGTAAGRCPSLRTLRTVLIFAVGAMPELLITSSICKFIGSICILVGGVFIFDLVGEVLDDPASPFDLAVFDPTADGRELLRWFILTRRRSFNKSFCPRRKKG